MAPFITGRIGLDGRVEEGVDALTRRRDTAVTVVVSPSGKGL